MTGVLLAPRISPQSLSRLAAICLLAVGSFASKAEAYSLNGKTWVSGTVTFELGLGNPGAPLTDGSTSWNVAALPALTTWNQRMQRIQLGAVMDSTAAAAQGDGVNSIVFSNTVFGQSFGSGTLGVTYYMMQGQNMVEADVLFNRAQTFDSYRGPLRFGGNGYAIADIRRTLLHELGHGIGLNHTGGDHIMAPSINDREALSGDDIAGAQAMYGAPAPTPTPTPTPTATPTPTPDSGPPRLANISTRMKVGVGDNVLIAGFIIQGSEPKRLILRATGPSLTAYGLNGAMQDPVLELRDAGGNLVAQNDDWQAGGQAAEISSTGVVPAHNAEPAIIATLAPGTYTAIVRGRNNTQGIALVEGYELSVSTTRLANLSTRGRIGTGDEVLIGGLIVQGYAGKRVIIRAIGPSLAGVLSGTLANPSLDVYNSSGQLIASNDNWTASAQTAEIVATTLPPGNSLESAVVMTLAPGNYTAMVRGVNNTTGIGLVEVYDLGQ